jgi:hypothetical protein
VENLDVDGNICRAWANIRGNIKISAQECLVYYGLKQEKPEFDEECSNF